MDKVYSVGIIGGGISGAVIALELSNLGIDNVLIEQKESLVNGPPFCHLHAGGNLYPDIPDEQCKVLLKQSIDMARIFPQSIDERPTLISIPKSEKYEVEKIEQRLKILVDYYRELIKENPDNEIIGSPEDYYRIYTKDDLIKLAKKTSIKRPRSPDEWIANAIKLIDYDKLKMPVILVQEYGWNLFRLGAQAQIALNRTDLCDLQLNTEVKHIKDIRSDNLDYNWEIHTEGSTYKVKYLVNSSGFKTGDFDKSLHLKTNRLIEFKAAYISKWKPIPGLIPELIFHGERGTPHGMAQLTPSTDDYYQIHGMTKDITLFENGLIPSKENEIQPEFNRTINKKLNSGWEKEEVNNRTENAIEFVSNFVPSFKTATVGGPPLFGAQQIPGNDPDLRVGEVNFPTKYYARSEIIKASSALVVANQIIDNIHENNITPSVHKKTKNQLLNNVQKEQIDDFAAALALQRGYPKALSRLVIEKA